MDTTKQVLEIITHSQAPVICMDSRADFDALCSCIILHRYITNILGKKVDVSFDGVLPESIRTIASGYADISFLQEKVCPVDIDFTKYDLHIFLDSGNIEHICKDNNYIPNPNITKLNIDHHKGNPLYGDCNYVKHYASCCTVLYYLFKEADIKIDASLASIYYLGVLLDSGFFQFDTVTSEDFQMVADLVKMGAKTYELNWKLTFNEKLQDMKLKGLVYSNLVVDTKAKVAYSTLSQAELKARGINIDQTTYRPSDMLKRLEGVDFIFVIHESEADKESFILSFRSHTANFDVLSIAKHFGGGGHIMAAGATIKAKTMQEAVDTVVNYTKQS